jgi:hypothetical protein
MDGRSLSRRSLQLPGIADTAVDAHSPSSSDRSRSTNATDGQCPADNRYCDSGGNIDSFKGSKPRLLSSIPIIPGVVSAGAGVVSAGAGVVVKGTNAVASTPGLIADTVMNEAMPDIQKRIGNLTNNVAEGVGALTNAFIMHKESKHTGIHGNVQGICWFSVFLFRSFH